MWLGIYGREKNRNLRKQRIELSGECLTNGCLRFERFLLDSQYSEAGSTFEFNRELVTEIARINAIEDPEALMRAYVDLFRGIGKCPVYMAQQHPAGMVRDNIGSGECAELDGRLSAEPRDD